MKPFNPARRVAAVLAVAAAAACGTALADPARLHQAFYDPDVSDEAFLALLDAPDAAEAMERIRALRRPSASKRFSRIGTPGGFPYIPPSYDTNLLHTVLYYRPRSLESVPDPAPVLFLLHGGGAGTASLMPAQRVAESYLRAFIGLAETENMILVAPVSPIGWGYCARFLLRDLARVVRAEMNTDPDRFYLYGHSMGGMGVTREAHFLVETFAGFISEAAGMQPHLQTDWRLRTYFDTQFAHILGERDHFSLNKPREDSFYHRSRGVQEKIRRLEETLDRPSGYRLVLHPGRHDIRTDLVQQVLRDTLLPRPRNLYAGEIFPVALWMHQPENVPVVLNKLLGEYLWLETLEMDPAVPMGGFSAAARDNRIRIDTGELAIRSLRVYLGRQMIDFGAPLEIEVNGRILFSGEAAPDAARMVRAARRRGDHRFLFETWIDLRIPQPGESEP